MQKNQLETLNTPSGSNVPEFPKKITGWNNWCNKVRNIIENLPFHQKGGLDNGTQNSEDQSDVCKIDQSDYDTYFQKFNTTYNATQVLYSQEYFDILYTLKLQGFDLFESDYLEVILDIGISYSIDQFIDCINIYIYTYSKGVNFIFESHHDTYIIKTLIHTKNYESIIDTIQEYKNSKIANEEIVIALVTSRYLHGDNPFFDKNILCQQMDLLLLCKEILNDDQQSIFYKLQETGSPFIYGKYLQSLSAEIAKNKNGIKELLLRFFTRKGLIVRTIKMSEKKFRHMILSYLKLPRELKEIDISTSYEIFREEFDKKINEKLTGGEKINDTERKSNIDIVNTKQRKELEKLGINYFQYDEKNRNLVVYFRNENMNPFEFSLITHILYRYITGGYSQLFNKIVITSRNCDNYPKEIHTLGDIEYK